MIDKEQMRVFALTKAMEFSNKPHLTGGDEDEVLLIAEKFYGFLTFNQDKFGLKENARQKAQEQRAQEVIEILNKLKY